MGLENNLVEDFPSAELPEDITRQVVCNTGYFITKYALALETVTAIAGGFLTAFPETKELGQELIKGAGYAGTVTAPLYLMAFMGKNIDE